VFFALFALYLSRFLRDEERDPALLGLELGREALRRR
jgi:hypothetical protein